MSQHNYPTALSAPNLQPRQIRQIKFLTQFGRTLALNRRRPAAGYPHVSQISIQLESRKPRPPRNYPIRIMLANPNLPPPAIARETTRTSCILNPMPDHGVEGIFPTTRTEGTPTKASRCDAQNSTFQAMTRLVIRTPGRVANSRGKSSSGGFATGTPRKFTPRHRLQRV